MESPQTEESSQLKPVLIFSIIMVLLLGLGGFLWWAFKSPARRVITVNTEQSANEVTTPERQPMRSSGPPLAPMPAIPIADDPGPTLVSLKLDNVMPREAITTLLNQGGGKLAAQADQGIFNFPPNNPVTLALDKQPFWSAMLTVSKQTGLFPYSEWQNPDQISLRREDPSRLNRPMIQKGSCLIVFDTLMRTTTIDTGDLKTTRNDFHAMLTAYVQPKVPVAAILSEAAEDSATDDQGNSLKGIERGYSYGGDRRSKWCAQVTVPLRYPSRPGKRITKLAGAVRVLLKGNEQEIKIQSPLTATNVTNTADGMTFRFISLKRQGSQQYVLDLEMPSGAERSPIFGYNAVRNLVHLRDAAGHDFDANGWGNRGGGGYHVMLWFSRGNSTGDPIELVIKVPTQLKEVRVPFEFDDLLMP